MSLVIILDDYGGFFPIQGWTFSYISNCSSSRSSSSPTLLHNILRWIAENICGVSRLYYTYTEHCIFNYPSKDITQNCSESQFQTAMSNISDITFKLHINLYAQNINGNVDINVSVHLHPRSHI